jgi:hypothetical protein
MTELQFQSIVDAIADHLDMLDRSFIEGKLNELILSNKRLLALQNAGLSMKTHHCEDK